LSRVRRSRSRSAAFSVHCRAVAYLCTACDRGQRYWSDVCAHAARRRAQRESDRRYQSSERGRLKHAERARQYRERRRSVTEQGLVSSPEQDLWSTSAPSTVSPPLSADETATTRAREATSDEKAHVGKFSCQFCRRWCDPWIRHAPLRRRRTAPRRAGRAVRSAQPEFSADTRRAGEQLVEGNSAFEF
jgi:hypothetical protein